MLNFTNKFEIEDLGTQEEYVYDIEVEDNHNFFGNNILAHNSVYYQIAPFVDEFKMKNPDATLMDCVDFAMSFEKEHISKIIKNTINQFADRLGAYDRSRIGAKVEICADTAIFIAKKRYIARVRDDEGTRFPVDSPKLKVMGLEIARSSTPSWCKEKLKEAIPILLDNDVNDVRKWLDKIKEEYCTQPLSKISMYGSISSLNYNLEDKGVPIGSRSGLVYNKYLRDNNLTDRYLNIKPGDKVKRLYLKLPNKFNSNSIAYISDNFSNEIDNVDYDMNFEKTFMSPLEIMTAPLNYDLRKTTQSLEDW